MTRPAYTTRPLSLLMIAGFAAAALWLFEPWGSVGSGIGTDAALPPALKVDGPVQVTTQGDVVTALVVPMVVRGSQGVELPDEGTSLRAETFMSESAAAAVPATYELRWLDGDDDRTLDPGEHVELLVTLPETTSVHPENPLRLVFRLAAGESITIDDVLAQ